MIIWLHCINYNISNRYILITSKPFFLTGVIINSFFNKWVGLSRCVVLNCNNSVVLKGCPKKNVRFVSMYIWNRSHTTFLYGCDHYRYWKCSKNLFMYLTISIDKNFIGGQFLIVSVTACTRADFKQAWQGKLWK